MIKKLCFAIFIFTACIIQAQNNSSTQQYREKIKHYLDKENALEGYYAIDSTGISMYSSPENKAKHISDYKVYWGEINWLKFLFGNFPFEEIIALLNEKKDNDMYDNASLPKREMPADSTLKGLRIAIDPGHIANTIKQAKMEKKFIDMKADLKNGLKQDVQLIEAQLTFATAMLLKEQLEKAGATVMLTRNQPGENAFGVSFEQWMQSSLKAAVDSATANKDITEEEKQLFLTKGDTTAIFRKLFTNLETKERARKINSFLPDFTIIIHYNVDEKNTDWKKPTNKNFNMTFVGGSFMKDEMEKPLFRAEFLRLLLCDDLEKSVNFSSYFIKSFEKNLAVPTAKTADADYLKQYCLPTGKPGVFCRNLTLTRMVHGTVVYGETLYQDNVKELMLLSKNEITVNGIQTSMRVQQVANAYYEAVRNYVKSSK